MTMTRIAATTMPTMDSHVGTLASSPPRRRYTKQTETVTGAIRIRAKSAPTTPISAEYWLEAGKENR